MILLLSCSKSWCQNNTSISSIGRQDSVLVAYDDLRKANAKMIELKYEKEINDSLRSVINNDKVIISNQHSIIENYGNQINILNTQISKERRNATIFKCSTVAAIILAIIGFAR